MLNVAYFKIREDDTKRLRREFADHRIYYGLNSKLGTLDVWYKPDNSRPYKITTAHNACHAIKLLHNRMKYDNMRAKDILADIDKYNDSLVDYERQDAVDEVRSQMKSIAAGKQYFIPPVRRMANAAV